MTFGVRSAYGTLERVLMHRPGPELDLVTEQTLREFNFDRPVDRTGFVRDYDAMVDCFHADGVDTVFLSDVLAADDDAIATLNRRPNVTYTRDLAAVFASGAVLMSPHLRGRWGDQRLMGRAFERLGVPVLGAIEPPGYLEGGGVTMIGEDTVVASICDRANQEGAAALRALVLGRDVKYFLEVPLPFGYIHIDGIFMVLDERLGLIFEEAFRTFPCWLHEAGRAEPRHVMFEEFLEARGVERLPISDAERLGGHLNVVVTERGTKAIGFAQATGIAERMRARGWTLSTFPSQELFVGNGGAHCMTCPLLVR
ncbi:MAG: arginine deiminase family protein [Vicinamibacterales bacterium]|jgi:N-dimethylarginine dimethylaminohydrolase|nr:hypothetical protein [Acidobacteriota bacterium]MDP7672507.1 arginine deiminase family protein [Vicinamibacterales bacterium]HJO37078.1 arginine deiminase family protein [Vicinamibacterales bacterium]|tara:strand:+ start:4678 stop:5613 length:936 start_codon:yes stop_codon:yes gene_type:complete